MKGLRSADCTLIDAYFMKAITYHRYGSPDVLQIEDIAKPTPGKGEVLIRVRASEATKADCEMRSFHYSVKWFWIPLRIALGITKPKRTVLGSYFAGEVAELGKGVRHFNKGDKIYGSANLRLGAYAEYLVLPEGATLAPKPENMTYAEAAAVPLGGLNALHFMRLAKVEPGERVLINGAGGVIGGHGVQVAKSMGAHVTAVDSGHKAALLARIGADVFIDYKKEDFTAQTEKFDVIFDMVPDSDYAACLALLNPGGRYLSGNPRFSRMLRSVLTTRFTDKTARIAFAKETREELTTLKHMIEKGQIVSMVDQLLPMEEAARAHQLVETEARKGAIVIDMGDAGQR